MSEEIKKGFRITSDPDTTSIEQPGREAAHTVDRLPLRMVLVSDFTPHASVDDWSGPSRLYRVDKHRFGTLMEEMAPRLVFDVPNHLGEAPKLLELDLAFPSLDAFHPEQVARQVPALAQLVQTRVLVGQVKRGEITLEAFRARLEMIGADAAWTDRLYQALAAPEAPPSPAPKPATPGGAPPSGGAPLDRLLGMVDLGGEAAETPPSTPSEPGGLMGALLGAVTSDVPAAPKVARTAADQVLGDLDAVIGRQLNAILGHEAFRRLEAAWRGLKFLVDRVDFRKNIQVEVLAAARGDLGAALYHQVLLPEHGGEAEKPPLSMIVVDAAFGNSAADLAALDDLADTAASMQAPLLVSAAPAFFGTPDYRGLASLPPLWQRFEEPAYIAWNKLRDKKTARYLAMALPAFLLRESYGAAVPAGALAFDEEGALWGNASLAVAAAVAASFARTGWPTHLVGASIENLPLGKTPQGHTPLAVLIPDSRLSEFVKEGFVVLGGKVNHDAVQVARAATVCRPEAYEDLMAATEARIHVTLACTLFVARAAHHMVILQNALPAGAGAEQVKPAVEAWLRAFFHTEGHTVPPDAVEVEQVEDSGVPDQDLLAVRLRAPRYVLDRSVSLVMGLPVPGKGDS